MESGDRPPSAARRWHILGFVLLAAAGAYAVVTSLRLGLWRQNSPGEGLFPFLIAVSVTAFSLAGLAGTLRAHDAPAQPAGGGRWRVGAYLAGLVFYALALDALGFSVATVLVVVFILRFAERYTWRTTLALAVGAAAGCWVLFVHWLGAILPAGSLWDRIFL